MLPHNCTIKSKLDHMGFAFKKKGGVGEAVCILIRRSGPDKFANKILVLPFLRHAN